MGDCHVGVIYRDSPSPGFKKTRGFLGGECKDAATGKSQPQPRSSSPHHLLRLRPKPSNPCQIAIACSSLFIRSHNRK
ncbi:hypothetical protein SAY86_009854 [Trapa natans]|uniref:Uncharacterized protein n=1 Tax=Trapa natans TaxID=22666 RepID=A0AAN7QQ12_TRANT|nr:hypothetical protein SAY86_009854 [Trapa natans]